MAEPAFLQLMQQTIQVSTRVSHNQYGTATWSVTASTYRCRYVEKGGFVRGRDGEDVARRGMLWVYSTRAIDISDRITLPDGTQPPIISVDRFPDERGQWHHMRVSLGF